MNNMKKYIKTLMVMACGILAACTTEENTELADSRIPIEFTATCVSNATRATIDNNWMGCPGQLVGVKIGDVVKPYTIETADNGYDYAKLTSDDPFYWTGKTETVKAWYPYTIGEQNPPEVVVSEDQSRYEYYRESDYIIAEQEVTFVSGQLPDLEFTHRTADIKIVITKEDGSKPNQSPNAVSIFIGDREIKACCPDAWKPNEYHALLEPQTVAQTKFTVMLMFYSGNIYKFSNKTEQTFEAGSQYSYTLTVDE